MSVFPFIPLPSPGGLSAKRLVEHLLLDRVGQRAMLLDVSDVVVDDEVRDAVMTLLRVELPAHLLRAGPLAVEHWRGRIVDAFGRVKETDIELGVVRDDGQRLPRRPDLVDPLVESHHRRAGCRHALEHAVGDAR